MLGRIRDYLQTGIWKSRLDDHVGTRRFLFKSLRIVVLAVREFRTDRCTTHASALTFYTLLSVVPVITMVLAIARGFGLDSFLKRHIWMSLTGQTALVEKVFTFADTLLKSSTNGVVAGIGVALLVWTVTSAVSNIEYAFDQIWEVAKPRRLNRRIPEYVALIVVGSLLWIISVGILIAASRQLRSFGRELGIPNLGALTALLLWVGRFVLVTMLFTAAYVVLPNTRIRFVSALFGGVAGAVIYHAVEWIYLDFQVGVANYSAVYGGFAAVPLFLAWVQATWMIVLFSAELAFSLDNAETYGFAPDYTRLPGLTRKLLQLRILHILVRAFEQDEGEFTTRQISERIEVPIRLLRPLLHSLTDSGLATRTLGADGHRIAYQLARSPEQLTLASALSALDQVTRAPSAPRGASLDVRPAEIGALPQALARFQAATAQVSENVRLKDIEDETFTQARS